MSDPRCDAGAVMALLDRAMTDAARGRAGDGRDVAAIDIHVSFLRQGSGPLTATASVCGGGKSVCFCEAKAADTQGHVVARSMVDIQSLALAELLRFARDVWLDGGYHLVYRPQARGCDGPFTESTRSGVPDPLLAVADSRR